VPIVLTALGMVTSCSGATPGSDAVELRLQVAIFLSVLSPQMGLVRTSNRSERSAIVQPETHYTRSGDVNIAYQVLGSGSRDLILVLGFVSNIEVAKEEPGFDRFLQRLASFSRLILFDKRGMGLKVSKIDPHDSTKTLFQAAEERCYDTSFSLLVLRTLRCRTPVRMDNSNCDGAWGGRVRRDT
jgi:hypothetical protein